MIVLKQTYFLWSFLNSNIPITTIPITIKMIINVTKIIARFKIMKFSIAYWEMNCSMVWEITNWSLFGSILLENGITATPSSLIIKCFFVSLLNKMKSWGWYPGSGNNIISNQSFLFTLITLWKLSFKTDPFFPLCHTGDLLIFPRWSNDRLCDENVPDNAVRLHRPATPD